MSKTVLVKKCINGKGSDAVQMTVKTDGNVYDIVEGALSHFNSDIPIADVTAKVGNKFLDFFIPLSELGNDTRINICWNNSTQIEIMDCKDPTAEVILGHGSMITSVLPPQNVLPTDEFPSSPNNLMDDTPKYTKRQPIKVSTTYTETTIPEHVQTWIDTVSIIIKTSNTNGLYATAEEMDSIIKVVHKGIVFFLGTLGNHPCVLVATNETECCRTNHSIIEEILTICKNANCIISIGAAIGLGSANLGDVLVATRIARFDAGRIKDDSVNSTEEKKSLEGVMNKMFTCADFYEWDFQCSDNGRRSKCILGLIVSCPYKLESTVWIDSITTAHPDAMGLEMEGYILQEIAKARTGLEIIICNGIYDHTIPKFPQKNSWEYTACKAAARYTRIRLENYPAVIEEREANLAANITKLLHLLKHGNARKLLHFLKHDSIVNNFSSEFSELLLKSRGNEIHSKKFLQIIETYLDKKDYAKNFSELLIQECTNDRQFEGYLQYMTKRIEEQQNSFPVEMMETLSLNTTVPVKHN